MRSRLWLVLSLFVVLFVPEIAHAEPATGFIGGLQDFVGIRDVEENETEIDDERILEQSKNDQKVKFRALPNDATPVDYVNNTLDAYTIVQWQNGRYSLLESIRLVLGARSGFLTNQKYMVPAFCLVFLWWGLRKTVRMLFKAFKKGKINA